MRIIFSESRDLKLAIVAIGFSVWTLPAQATAIYNFTSAPITVESFRGTFGPGTEEIVTDRRAPPGILGLFFSAFPVDTSLHASLSFNEPLPVSTRTVLHAESGGYNLFNPTEGDLTAYSASGQPAGYPITSNLDAYNPNPKPDGSIEVDRYSKLDGYVITNSLGNISDWELHFALYDAGGTFPVTINPTRTGTLGIVDDVLLDIRSGPAVRDTIPNVISLNGVPMVNDDYDFDRVDRVFYDPGQRYNSYTDRPGSFVAINQVPTSGTLPLLLVALLGWGLFEKKWEKSAHLQRPKMAVVAYS